ncbi:MAG: hypothetical protein WBY88_03370 [Desulfosarcina sp.]
MNDYFSRFRSAPPSLKKSAALLMVAWICHPLFIHAFFWANDAVAQAQQIILRMAIVSVCLAIFLLLIKKWARALVVTGNLLIVIYDLFVLAAAPSNTTLMLLCTGVVVFTVLGTYWLFVKDSRDYFDQVNPTPRR